MLAPAEATAPSSSPPAPPMNDPSLQPERQLAQSTPHFVINYARDYLRIAITDFDQIKWGSKMDLTQLIKRLFHFASNEHYATSEFESVFQGICCIHPHLLHPYNGPEHMKVSTWLMNINGTSRGEDSTGGLHGVWGGTKMQREVKSWEFHATTLPVGRARPQACRPKLNVWLEFVRYDDDLSSGCISAMLGERKIFYFKKGTLGQSSAFKTDITSFEDVEHETGHGYTPATNDEVRRDPVPVIRRLPSNLQSLALKICKAAFARALIYLISGNEAYGTFLGMVQIHSRFSRLYHLGAITNDQQNLEDLEDGCINNNNNCILVEVSEETLSRVKIDNDKIPFETCTMMSSDFIRSIEDDNFLAYDLSQPCTNDDASPSAQLDRVGVQVYLNSHLKAMEILLDTPVSTLPLPRFELSETARHYKKVIIDRGVVKDRIENYKIEAEIAARTDVDQAGNSTCMRGPDPMGQLHMGMGPSSDTDSDIDMDMETDTDAGTDSAAESLIPAPLTAENLRHLEHLHYDNESLDDEVRQEEARMPPLKVMSAMLDKAGVCLVLISKEHMTRLWETKTKPAESS